MNKTSAEQALDRMTTIEPDELTRLREENVECIKLLKQSLHWLNWMNGMGKLPLSGRQTRNRIVKALNRHDEGSR